MTGIDGSHNFRRFVHKLSYVLAWLGMFALLPLMFLTTVDVVGRFVWNKPVPGAVELSSYILVAFVLSGLAYTHQRRGHVRVTMLLERLGPKPALAVEALTILMSMAITLVIAWQGWVIAWEQTTVSDMLRVPQRPFRLLVSLAGGCFFLELLLDLLGVLGRLVSPPASR